MKDDTRHRGRQETCFFACLVPILQEFGNNTRLVLWKAGRSFSTESQQFYLELVPSEALDLPVLKRSKAQLKDLTVNSVLHWQELS
jgi:hypothetical protein